ncbi:FixH family protein [Bdellovibrio sp. HCB-162]|uniref:FixH family protein n=1 Tax=Bdellovibrio sp. HCB-162 TaxID=3394234 RepID=UPI0039BD4702
MKTFLQLTLAAFLFLGANSARAFGEHGDHGGGGHHDHNTLCPVYFALADVCAEIEFTKGPLSGDESQFLVKFFDHKSAHGEHVMVDPQNIKLDLWMNMGGHGHGSSPVKIVKQSQGVYFVSEAYFVMSGRWNIRFNVDGEQAEFTIDVQP